MTQTKGEEASMDEEAEFRHQILCYFFATRTDDAQTWYDIERQLEPLFSLGMDKLLHIAAKMLELEAEQASKQG